MQYVVVFCDHDGAWHAVVGPANWDFAWAAYCGMVTTLVALDYYDDTSPAVAKIIDDKGVGQDYYEQASALSKPAFG